MAKRPSETPPSHLSTPEQIDVKGGRNVTAERDATRSQLLAISTPEQPVKLTINAGKATVGRESVEAIKVVMQATEINEKNEQAYINAIIRTVAEHNEVTSLVIDFKGVEKISFEFLRMLTYLGSEFSRKRKTLVVLNLVPKLQENFSICKLYAVMRISTGTVDACQ